MMSDSEEVVDNASATDFTDRQLIDIAHAIDADVPAE